MRQNPQSKVGLGQLKDYLLHLGWRTQPHPNRRISVFAPPIESTEVGSIILPAGGDLDDMGMVSTALREIGHYQNCELCQVIHRVSNWTQDTLRVRIFDAVQHIEDLSLSTAASIIGNLKKFMGYSAHNQISPKPFFEKAGPICGDFASTCRFGHTFEGSFGFRIECPFSYEEPILPMDNNPPDLPFERKVMERIANGFRMLSYATSQGSCDALLDGYVDGLNANTLRLLADTYETVGGASLEFDLIWGGKIPSAEPKWEPFVFDAKAFVISRYAAQELEKVDEQQEHVIVSLVTVLKSDQPPEEEGQMNLEHTITMFWERERKNKVKIRVPLSAADYISACDAHKVGRKIRIVGQPKKDGKTWTLTKCHDFTVL